MYTHRTTEEMNTMIVDLHITSAAPFYTDSEIRTLGFPSTPLFAHVASTTGDYWRAPEYTMTGVVCGDCTDTFGEVLRHASVAMVRGCWAYAQECKAQYDAEAPLIRAGIL